MTSDGLKKRRKHVDKLVWGLGTKLDWKQVIAGCALMCVSLSAVVVVLVQSAIDDVPPTGFGLVAAFVAFVGVLSGFMIAHRGAERSWL